MSHQHSNAFVLLPAARMPSADAFASAWAEALPGVAPLAVTSWSGESAALELDGIATVVALVPAPVPDREADEAARLSVSAFRDGGFTPAPHAAHLVVVSTSPTASHAARLLRQTRVMAALARAGGATGIYDGNAGATHEPDFFIDVAQSEELPLMLWNGVTVSHKTKTFAMLTLGMAQLELPDVLLVARKSDGMEALAFLFDLARYVVDRGTALREGETVGRTAEEKLAVRYVACPLGRDVRVMRIELPGATEKKSWWPFGGG